jgi:hypothetical protein
MAPNQELLLLISAVVLEFLKLATTFTNSSAVAIVARRPLEKEAFYTKLHVEFKSLDETLSAWDHSLGIPEAVEHTLNRALDVLESRFIKLLVRNPSAVSHLRRDCRLIFFIISERVVLILI